MQALLSNICDLFSRILEVFNEMEMQMEMSLIIKILQNFIQK